jgi:hypothetical protein
MPPADGLPDELPGAPPLWPGWLPDGLVWPPGAPGGVGVPEGDGIPDGGIPEGRLDGLGGIGGCWFGFIGVIGAHPHSASSNVRPAVRTAVPTLG